MCNLHLQAALDLPALGLAEGSADEGGVRLFDAIAVGAMTLNRLHQEEMEARRSLDLVNIEDACMPELQPQNRGNLSARAPRVSS